MNDSEPTVLEPIRESVVVDPAGALMSVMNTAMQADIIRVGVGTFLEGRGLRGSWSLRITGAELIPVDAS